MATIKPEMDPFMSDWGHMPKRKSSAVKKLLRAYMKRIGMLTESDRVEEIRSHRPSTFAACSSCGLCPKTDFKIGYFQTAYAILHSVCFNKRFMCHSNQPGWEKEGALDASRLRPCGNMHAIMIGHYEELIELSRQTMFAIRQIMRSPVR